MNQRILNTVKDQDKQYNKFTQIRSLGNHMLGDSQTRNILQPLSIWRRRILWTRNGLNCLKKQNIIKNPISQKESLTKTKNANGQQSKKTHPMNNPLATKFQIKKRSLLSLLEALFCSMSLIIQTSLRNGESSFE